MFENEENVTAQTSDGVQVSTVTDNGNADVIKEDEKEQANETEFSSDGATDRKESNPKQTAAQNAENARRRREAEAARAGREKELRDAKDAGLIEALGGKNPYTGEDMKDARDVEEFRLMQQIEKEGGDPMYDFARYHKAAQREQENKILEQEREREWYGRDREAFLEKYPDVDISALAADENFAVFAEGKVGKRPLSQIYEAYQSMLGNTAKQAREMAAQMIANKQASPGALATPDKSAGDFFTAEQVRGMSPADVKKNYDTIVRSMQKW